MKPFYFLIPLVCLLTGCYPPPPGPPVREFADVGTAQRYCGNDTVVWIDALTGTYHEPNDHWYGRIFGQGGYVCKADALRAPYMHPGHGLTD